MRMTSLARRYAGALFYRARDMDVIEQVESDLGLITYSLKSIPRLAEAFMHPLIPEMQKKKITAEVFESKVQEITLHFLYLLIDKRRTEILEDVEREYISLARTFRGIVTAYVTSAVPLTVDEQSRLRAALAKHTGKEIELSIEENPDIIGGLTICIGDTVMDGSVKGYLTSLKESMLGTAH